MFGGGGPSLESSTSGGQFGGQLEVVYVVYVA